MKKEKLDAKIKNEIDELVLLGKRIFQRAQSLDNWMEGDELAAVSSWVTRLGQIIRKLFGAESQQFVSYSDALKTENFYRIHRNWNTHISQLYGITLSIQHDFAEGLLFNIRTLIQAETLSDFLERGESLLNEKYKDAAAVIIGAVLEDSLQKLCIKNGIEIASRNGKPLTIEPLNSALANANVYNKLVQKQITTCVHIFNKAIYGEYPEYNQGQVEMMLLFVQSFTADYLT